jgi:hypothetical protein
MTALLYTTYCTKCEERAKRFEGLPTFEGYIASDFPMDEPRLFLCSAWLYKTLESCKQTHPRVAHIIQVQGWGQPRYKEDCTHAYYIKRKEDADPTKDHVVMIKRVWGF